MEIIPSVLVNIANKMELAANLLFVATVTNLARHPENAEHLVYNLKGLVPTLLPRANSFLMVDANVDSRQLFNAEDEVRQYAATGKLIHTPKLERLRINC
eukprot:scaffold15507_cov74-Cyclotella_meneghiniana.AAC.4